MRHSLNQRNQKGFTIIEVLIVLAIAGLIMLIVFLAVPALQRNSRNTSRRNDVSRILGAAQEVLNNNSGDLTQLTNANLQNPNIVGTLAYYQATNVTVSGVAPAATGTNNTTEDTVVLFKGATCSSNKAIPGATRQLAITYTIEKSINQCTNS
jgi:prepilin-type N-terminal cleavage/methylation domain-containing protein